MFNLDLQLKKLLIKAPLLSSYMDWLKFQPTSLVNTGATDGKTVYYNPDNLSKRDELGQQFTLVHEILHVALKHMERQEDREQDGFNYACDAVINQMIKKFGIPIPYGSIDCPEAINYSAEEYYDLIRSRDNYNDLMHSLASNPESENIITPHIYWKKGIDNKDNENEKTKDIPTNEQDFLNQNDEIKKKKSEEFFNNLSNSSTYGYEKVNKKIKNIGTSTSFVSWQDLLKYNIQKNKSDYDFFNGEFDEYGMWNYPYKVTFEDSSLVEILIDTSYSVDEELVKKFLREVKSIVGNAKIKIGCFNTKFDGFVEIKDEADIDNFMITSRGGTDFEIAVKSFEYPNSTKIVFTDGYAEVPTSFCEAIWIIYSDKQLHPPGGFVYNVDVNSFEKKGLSR